MSGWGNERTDPEARGISPAARAQRRRVEMPATQRVRFEQDTFGSVTLIDPKPANPYLITLYEAPDGIDYAETVAIGIKGIPLAVWHNLISWTFHVEGAGIQEFIGRSGIAIAGVTPTDRDAGLRWEVFGSLHRPQPIAIRLRAGHKLQIAIVDHGSVASFPNVPLTVHARIIGYQFLRGGAI